MLQSGTSPHAPPGRVSPALPAGPARAQRRLLVIGADALDAAIDTVLEQAAREVGAQRCALMLFDPEQGGALVDRYWVAPGLRAPQLERLELPWVCTQLRAGRPVVFSRAAQLPLETEQERQEFATTRIQSAILVPLRAAGTTPLGWIGFVTLQYEHVWTAAEVETASRYGEIIAPALLRLRAERERDEQLDTHALLAEVSAAFVALPPQRVLAGVGEALRILAKHLGAYRGTAWQLEEDGVGVRLLAQWREGAEALPAHMHMAQPGIEPLLRSHLRAGQPWCVSDLDQLPAGSSETRTLLESWGVGSFLAMPLRAGEREVGWLTFSKPRPSPWPQALVCRMGVVGDLVSAALVRARDAERVRSAEQEAHATHDLLQASLDALSAHVAITDAAGHILAVNEAWRHFTPAGASGTGVGANYLEVCRRASAEQPEAGLILEAVPALLRGERRELRLAYPCAAPGSSRWFQLRVTHFAHAGEPRLLFAHEDVTELKQAEEQLHQLAGELVQVQDTERRRIASVLHDGAAQQVFAGILGVRAARRAGHPASAELAECQEVLEQALLQLRTLSHLLHPPLLDEAGLGPALRAYVDSFSTRSGLALTLEGLEQLERIAPEAEHALFLLVQEALLNVQRHSGSARARVRVEHDATTVQICVSDEGRGLPPASLQGGPTVGLASMRQRLLQVGGSLELRSGPAGTEVCGRVPRSVPPG